MQTENNINVQLVTYGVAVHGDTDSGWKITGFTPGLGPEKSLKLATFTSVGEISETWARVFEHGFGYFGRLPEEDRAIFALFYRSQVKSARGRHFVPRIVLSIPYSDYVDKLNSDPEILFQYLVKYKEEKAPVQCDREPMELKPFYHISPSPRTPGEQLHPLNRAIDSGAVTREFLVDFLTAILRPEHHCTLVWGGEKPDVQLVLSMIFLLPPTLRQFITFCTSVENPRVGNFRIKIIKEPVAPENNTFVVMKDNRFTIRKSPISFETQIPEILVEELISPGKTGTDVFALSEIQQFIESKLEADPVISMNFKRILKNGGLLAELYFLRKQVKISCHPGGILTHLLKYFSKLETLREEKVLENQHSLEEERQFVVNQFARVVQEIKNETQMETVKAELQKLAKKLPGLKEPEKLSETLFTKGEELPLKAFLPILKACYSIPALKETIDLELFKQLKLKHTPGWKESFKLVTMIRNASQCYDLKTKNKKLYDRLKKQPGIDYFIDLLLLSFPSQKLDENLFNGACKKVEQIGKEHKDKIFVILLFVFKRLKQFDPGLYHFYFLSAAAYSYKFINKIFIFAKQEQEFKKQFSLRLYQVCNLKLDQDGEEHLKKICDTISEVDPSFAERLEIIGKQAIFSRHLEECNHLLGGRDRPIFREKGDLYRFLRQLDKNKVSRFHPYLSTAGLHLIIGNNRPPAPTLYADYLDYLKQKEEFDDIDMQNIIGILIDKPSPIDYTHLLETLTLAFSRRSEQSLSLARFVSFLLNLAKDYEKGEGQNLVKIENTFITTVKDKWKPNTCDEVREIYQAVNRGLGKSLGDRILWSGFSKLSNKERMKYFTRVLNEYFNEFSLISRDDWAYLKELLEWIDSEDIWNLMYIQDELNKIKEEKDTIENNMEKIKTLLKKLKKIKLYHHEKDY